MEYKEVLAEVFDSLGNLQVENVTGFEDIDSMLAGAEKGSLFVIGARPSMGKTCFMMSILENLLKQKHRCAYFSLEMSNKMFIHRFLVQHAKIDYNRLRTNNMYQKDWEKLSEILGNISEYDLFLEDFATLTIEKLEEKIKEIKPEYVFIDYLQLMDANSKKARSEELAKILLEIKRLAKENNLFIFISSQLSRAIENRCDKRPMLCDLRETGAIEDFADVVMFIYREDYYCRYDEEDYAWKKGKADIIVAKNKFGPTGIVDLLFQPEILKFEQPIRTEIF